MNQNDRSQRRRWGAYSSVLSAAVGSALVAAMIPAAPAFADPTDDAVGAVSTSPGCCEATADADLFAHFYVQDGPAGANALVEALNTDLSGLSNPAASALEEAIIAAFGGGVVIDAAAVLP